MAANSSSKRVAGALSRSNLGGGQALVGLGKFPIAGSTCSLLPTPEHGRESPRVDGALARNSWGTNAIGKLGNAFCASLFDDDLQWVVICSHLPTSEHGGEPNRVDGALARDSRGKIIIGELGTTFWASLFYDDPQRVVICSFSSQHARWGRYYG